MNVLIKIKNLKKDGICNYYFDEYSIVKNSDFCIKPPNYNGKIASCDYTCAYNSQSGWCKKTAKCVRKNESCIKCIRTSKKKFVKTLILVLIYLIIVVILQNGLINVQMIVIRKI